MKSQMFVEKFDIPDYFSVMVGSELESSQDVREL